MGSAASAQTGWIDALERRARLWIVPEFKIVFVSIAKNASTSIKWVLTDLAREDPRKIKAGLHAYIHNKAAVHNRAMHPNIPYAGQLEPTIRAEIDPENGWFIFAVVRDPRSRVFSAWQDRVLLAHPARTYRRWATEPWYPERPGEDAATINQQFADFVDAAVSQKKFPPRGNTHFRSQTEGLDIDHIPYTTIYPIEKLTDLQADLTRHVQALGWTDPINFPRGNDTPLPANGAVFAGDVRAKIEQWYADDFAQFGDQFDFSRIASAPEWTAAQLREVHVRVALHDRLAEVRQIALKHRARAEKANKRADALARQLGGAAQKRSGSTPAAKKTATKAAAKQAARKAAKKAARKVDPASAAPTMGQGLGKRGGADQERGWRARLRAPR